MQYHNTLNETLIPPQKILSINEKELPSSRWLDDCEIFMEITPNKPLKLYLQKPHPGLIKTLMTRKKLAPAEPDTFATAHGSLWNGATDCLCRINPALRYILF